VIDPAAAVASVMDDEPVAGDRDAPWDDAVDLVAASDENVELRVPLALLSLVLVGALGVAVARRPRG
jgi:hypothetical protein